MSLTTRFQKESLSFSEHAGYLSAGVISKEDAQKVFRFTAGYYQREMTVVVNYFDNKISLNHKGETVFRTEMRSDESVAAAEWVAENSAKNTPRKEVAFATDGNIEGEE